MTVTRNSKRKKPAPLSDSSNRSNNNSKKKKETALLDVEYPAEVETIAFEASRLTWRSNPVASFSDFVIQVELVDGTDDTDDEKKKKKEKEDNDDDMGEKTERSAKRRRKEEKKQQKSTRNQARRDPHTHTYHVHKCIVAFGRRKMNLLTEVLRLQDEEDEEALNDSNSSSSNSKKYIQLPVTAAKLFPRILDYIYHPEEPLAGLTTDSVGAIACIAKKLDMKHLCLEVESFWKQDLSKHTAAVYYQQALEFQNKGMQEDVLEWCRPLIVENPSALDALVKDPNSSHLWLDLLRVGPPNSTSTTSDDKDQDERVQKESFSLAMSILIAEHCQHCEKESKMDGDMFQTLTDPKYLTHLDFDAAKILSDLEDRMLAGTDENSNANTTTTTSRSSGGSQLTSLQERCVASFAQQWRRVEGAQKDLMKWLKRKGEHFVAALLFGSLNKVSNEKS